MALSLQDLLDLFPDNTAGEISAADMRLQTTELFDKITVTEDNFDNFLPVSGLVPLEQGYSPSIGQHIATKAYTDNVVGSGAFVSKSGDTMTGSLILPLIEPTTSLSATPKSYVDSLLQQARMNWRNRWDSLGTYQLNDVTLDGAWTMIANKTTQERPAPQPFGAETFGLPDVPAFIEVNNVSSIFSGHIYTFNQGGWVTALRIWIPEISASTNYRVIVIDETDPDNLATRIFENPNITEDDWAVVTLSNTLITAGTIWRVVLDSLSTGASIDFTGEWTRSIDDNSSYPPSGGWNTNVNGSTMRMSQFDTLAVDRSADFDTIIPNSDVLFVNTGNVQQFTQYLVTSIVKDVNTYIFGVTLIEETLNGVPVSALSDTTVTIPIAQATNYVHIVGGIPASNPDWAAVTGVLEFDGVDQGGDLNNYGVDISFQKASISEDWDLVAFSGEFT